MAHQMISSAQVRSLVRMPTLLAQMRTALADFSAGRVVQPVRSVVNVEERNGFLGVMPAYSKRHGLGAKLVTFFPRNDEFNVPSHHALILLFSPETGQPTAIMDGGVVTEMRTAACSAIATDELAYGRETLCVLGSGVQARSHLEALSANQHWKNIHLWSRTRANAEALHAEITDMDIGSPQCHVFDSAEDAVADADVIVVATSSPTPVIKGAWLKPGAHVNSVGACRPDWREMDDELMQNADVFVDSSEGAKKESGDVIQSQCKIVGEIGELINGAVKADRSRTTVFKSLGLAIEDVASARLVLDALQQSS